MTIEAELEVFAQLGNDLAKGGSKRVTFVEGSEKQPRKGKGKPSTTKVTPSRPLKGVKAKPTPTKLTGGKGKMLGKSVDESESESSSGEAESPVAKSENLCKCGSVMKKGETTCSKCVSKSVGSGSFTQFVDDLHGLSDNDIAKMISKGVPSVVFNAGTGEEQ